MKPLSKAILLVLLGGVCLSGCSPVPYQVVGHNAPLLRGKNEVNVNAALAGGEDASGLGLQTAWAFDSTWALMSSYYSMKSASTWDEPEEWKGKGRYFELGIGSFAARGRAKGVVYEGFLGTGFTRIRNHYQENKLDVNYMNTFVQGSLGYSTPVIDIALTTRISYMRYTNKSYSFTELEHQERADNFFDKNNSKILFEPGITFRIGYRNLKAHLSYVTSTFKEKGDIVETGELQLNTDFVSFGLNCVFTNRFSN